jgi:hypothetical protein
MNIIGLIFAILVLAGLCFLVFRPAKKYTGAIKV